MKTRFLSILLVFSFLSAILFPSTSIKADTGNNLAGMPVIENVEGYYHKYFIVPEHFIDNLGTWKIVKNYAGSFRDSILYGATNSKREDVKPATTSIQVLEDSKYYVWVRARDFYDRPGSRHFKIEINGTLLSETFGDHGYDGWAWEKAGPVNLKSGEVTISMVDTSAHYARMNAIIITNDPNFVPNNESYEKLKEDLVTKVKKGEQEDTNTPEQRDYIFLRPESFKDLGTWIIDSNEGAFGGINLRGLTSYSAASKPAVAEFNVNASGTYKVWVRSRDYGETSSPRPFRVRINGTMLEKEFGRHRANAWQWEDGGTIELQPGKNVLELLDMYCYYARTDGIFITSDLEFVPPNKYEDLIKIAPAAYKFEDRLVFPEWAKSSEEPAQEYTLENDYVRVKFYVVKTQSGNVIQKETYIKHKGEFIQVENRTDEFGYLLMYTTSSDVPSRATLYPVFKGKVEYEGELLNIIAGNVFAGGLPSWMVPTDIKKVDENTVILTSENELAKLEAEWKVTDDCDEPVVKLKLTAKKDGNFSIGMFNSKEMNLEDIDFLLNPYRFHSKRLPEDPYLVNEKNSSSASVYMTLTKKAGEEDIKVTYALAVDPECIPYRWVYDDNSLFGLGIMGRYRGVQPSLFAPLMGMPDSRLEAGNTYEFTYRPVTRIDDWFETYTYVTREIFGLTDYRKNYLASLTDTTFNVQKLIMDDNYGGWDNIMKAHYNMEADNTVTVGTVLAQIQSYLLTEDKEIYERRTIPTIEFMLSRGAQHFTSTENVKGAKYVNVDGASPVGKPVSGFGNSVFGGAYLMTQGLTIALRQIGIDSGHKTGGGNAQGWSEYLWMYKYTGNEEYLEKAKNGADNYLKYSVFSPQKVLPGYESFIYISYYPNFQALLDMYEITGEQKYLDGAVEGARWLLTTIWTQPMPGDGEITIDADLIREMNPVTSSNFFWKGSYQERLGFPDKLKDIQNETVEAWVPSRVGLGIEQASTFTKSSNIIMSNWAPDLIRLSKYTGDGIYEMYARNAILGRGANYPGYYQKALMALQKTAEYPYEGPDVTSIYYHHIPVYLGILQDFLISQAWSWSDGKIDFPYVRQQGYAYFINRQYGFAPGKFFDEDDMWLWIKEGLITVDNIQIDWIGARKDGVVGFALMNEDTQDIQVTVKLGEELGGSSFSGKADVYTALGEKSTIDITEGSFKITVPSHQLVGITIRIPSVKKPNFADIYTEDKLTAPIGNTIAVPESGDDFGYGYVIQIDPASYFAYVYTTHMADAVKKAVLNYKIGDGEWKQAECSTYPFEFSIKVDSPENEFSYYMEITKKDGTVQKSQTKVLKPLTLK